MCYIYIVLFFGYTKHFTDGRESPQPPPVYIIHLDYVTEAILCQTKAPQTSLITERRQSDEAN